MASISAKDNIHIPYDIGPSDEVIFWDRSIYNGKSIFLYSISNTEPTLSASGIVFNRRLYRFRIAEAQVDGSGSISISQDKTVSSVSFYGGIEGTVSKGSINLTSASMVIFNGEPVYCISGKRIDSSGNSLYFEPNIEIRKGSTGVIAYRVSKYPTGQDGPEILSSTICTNGSELTVFFSESDVTEGTTVVKKIQSTDGGLTWNDAEIIHTASGPLSGSTKGLFSKYRNGTEFAIYGVRDTGWAYHGETSGLRDVVDSLESGIYFNLGNVTQSLSSAILDNDRWYFSSRGINYDYTLQNRDKIVYRKGENDYYFFRSKPDNSEDWFNEKFFSANSSESFRSVDIGDNGGTTSSSEMTALLGYTSSQGMNLFLYKTLSSPASGPFQYTLSNIGGLNYQDIKTDGYGAKSRPAFSFCGSNRDKGVIIWYHDNISDQIPGFNAAIILTSYDLPVSLATGSILSTGDESVSETSILDSPIVTAELIATPVTASTTTNTESPTIEFEAEFTMSFNVIQQGVNDQFDLPLEEVEEGVYRGKFSIDKQDGVYNKDGVAAIVLNIPNPCTQVLKLPCKVKSLDSLNRNDLGSFRDFSINYGPLLDNISPESLLSEYKKGKLSKTVNIKDLKDQYSSDDPRYSFANPKFFNKKRTNSN